MRVVLDTNVLVSGLLTPFSPCGEIVRMAASGVLTLCLDARILGEYSEVLRRPRFRFNAEHVAALLDYLFRAGSLVAASPLAVSLPDPDDNAFLEVAIHGLADCLITGNLKHYPVRTRQGIEVLSPREFIDHCRDR